MDSGGRLVMVGGASPGAGKSTLTRQMTSLAGGAVTVIAEDDVWGRREVGLDLVDPSTARADFRQAIFGTRNTTQELTALFVALAAECAEAATLWLQDWTWPDLVALACDEATESERIAVSTRLRTLADPLRPLILYVDVPPEVAIRRALAERGPVWLNRHFCRPPTGPVQAEDVQAAASDYEERRGAHLEYLRAAGWHVRHLDGQARPGVVARSALAIVVATS